ncbi:hypothetical protein [Acinetobacter vivianii]|uniref:hypothetical protein n=1 Tax=Acinetobacter vivianii TaxID=1776742 RepID=UPI0040422154
MSYVRLKWFFIVLILTILGIYLTIITAAKYEWLGEKPQNKIIGSVESPFQREMQQYCTGIKITPSGTWLVARSDSTYFSYDKPSKSFDLNTLLPPKKADEYSNFLGFSKEIPITYISRLNDQGHFEEVARFEGVGCLVPILNSVLVLTDLNKGQQDYSKQTAVFRSDDQGRHWKIQNEGFFSSVEQQAWTVRPTAYKDNALWVWKDFAFEQPTEGLAANQPSGLYFSKDQGKNIETIMASAPLLFDITSLTDKSNLDPDWKADDLGEIKAFITQLHDDHAILWVTQVFSRALTTGSFQVTTQAKLDRINDKWVMGEVKRIQGLAIKKLAQNTQGKVITIQNYMDQDQDVIAELLPENLSWKIHGTLPHPFSPFNGSSYVYDIWITHDALLITTMSEHIAARILQPSTWRKPTSSGGTVSATAVFYSKDWGTSWQKLAIKGYLRVLGVEANSDQVFWVDGSVYESKKDTHIYSHQLK